MKRVGSILTLATFLALPLIHAQTTTVQATPLSENDIRLLRQNVQASKDNIIRDTMRFTSTEGSAFWPVYSLYAKGQQQLAEQRLQLVNDYAQRLDKMDDA